MQLYTDYFGPSLFKHMQLTQQTACNFGQSWPELVWIPICYYFDTTVRHQLGMDWGDRGYWKVVTPHEVAHQWWGHTVGFSSGRDQWMSEGFADMSASLYFSMIEKNPKKFITFWNDEREMLLERDAQGFRAIDAGPLTMGYRTSNSRTGFDTTRRLIYPKGAYVLHMIRMMMRDNRTGDQHFKETMQDFVKTYSRQSRHHRRLQGHGRKTHDAGDGPRGQPQDGLVLQRVRLRNPAADRTSWSRPSTSGADGDVVLSMKMTQSNVDEQFRMLVPLYLELADGNMFFLGRARLAGNSSVEQKVPLKGLKTKPKRGRAQLLRRCAGFAELEFAQVVKGEQRRAPLDVPYCESTCYLPIQLCMPSLDSPSSRANFLPSKRAPASELRAVVILLHHCGVILRGTGSGRRPLPEPWRARSCPA